VVQIKFSILEATLPSSILRRFQITRLSRTPISIMGNLQYKETNVLCKKTQKFTTQITSAQLHNPPNINQSINRTHPIRSPHTDLRCFLLNRRLARAGFTARTSLSWSARLGAKMGRSTLLAAMLARSRTGAFSPICRVDSKSATPCDEDSGPVELLTSTRRVRWRSWGGLGSRRNGLSVKMRRRKRGMVDWE
jgi:hypothetical protein